MQDELSRSTDRDIPTIAISYAVMFFYISLALGRLWPLDRRFLVRTKCTLAFSAILLVLFSLAIAVGLVCSMGVKMTPIISEVIPFLVLAIGIDNVFILLHTFQRQDRRRFPSVEARLKRTLREVGTSITLASMSEAVAFILGGQTKMPAVRAFAFYSCAAILADYVLQITAFTAVLVLDARRTESGRIDCCPCFTVDGADEDDEMAGRSAHSRRVMDGGAGHAKASPESSFGGEEYKYNTQVASPQARKHTDTMADMVKSKSSLQSPFLDPDARDSPPSGDHPGGGGGGGDGVGDTALQSLMRRRYVPFLLHRMTKMCVLIVFVLTFFFMVAFGIHNLQLGLDHKYVVPKDSYLQDYFADLKDVFAVGPPVYFVVEPSNRTDFQYPDDQNRVCSQSGCSESSVQSIIFNQVCDPSAYIAQGPSSWLDDYITWLKIRAPCCRTFKFAAYGHKVGDWCPIDNRFTDLLCPMCLQPEDFIVANNVTRPPPWAFTKYLEMYLTKSECSTSCGSCGWGHNADVIWDAKRNRTGATRYMAYHSPLRSEEEFIGALKSGRRISKMIAEAQKLDTYVYSVVYPFFEVSARARNTHALGVAALVCPLSVCVISFCASVWTRSLCVPCSLSAYHLQQYLYIVDTCVLNTGLGLAGIMVLSMVLIRNFWASLQIVVTICMILGDLLGVMAMWNITLNGRTRRREGGQMERGAWVGDQKDDSQPAETSAAKLPADTCYCSFSLLFRRFCFLFLLSSSVRAELCDGDRHLRRILHSSDRCLHEHARFARLPHCDGDGQRRLVGRQRHHAHQSEWSHRARICIQSNV